MPPAAETPKMETPETDSQPIVEPRKRLPILAKIVIGVLLVLGLGGLGFIAFIGYGLSNLSNRCAERTNELQRLAEQNTDRLNSLTIVDGQHPKATGAPDGDCLTGKGGPAAAVYPVSGKVSDLNVQIARNLKTQGFEVSPTFHDDGAGNTSVTDVWTTATDGNSTLEIRYKLDPRYLCPETKPACAGEGIIEEANLLNRQASAVSVILGGVIITP